MCEHCKACEQRQSDPLVFTGSVGAPTSFSNLISETWLIQIRAPLLGRCAPHGGGIHTLSPSQDPFPALQSFGDRADVEDLQVFTMLMPSDTELKQPGDPAQGPVPTISSLLSPRSKLRREPPATQRQQREHQVGGLEQKCLSLGAKMARLR